jgi:X-X-X-Leu-X-X-Gly heptad repeat protein
MRDQITLRLLLVLALMTGASCRNRQEKSAESSGAAQLQKGAETMAGGAKEMAQGFEALGKGLAEMATDSSLHPVEPVSFRDLQTIFPDLSGWEKGKPTGEKMSTPVSFSRAEVKYRKGSSTIDAKLVDSGFNKLLMAPFAMFLTTGYEKETENGYEKSVKIGEYPGWEKWNSQSKDGELNAVINKRFLLTLEGEGLADTAVLHELARKSDLARLAAIK